MKIVAIIPARLASTRFPRKVLLLIHGLPMIEHVWRRALLCKMFSDVL
jgi:3-deoxy-manno-octulosonate cytidylyltransferase (CMP-KDO synthetase)